MLLAGCQAVSGYPPPTMSRTEALGSVKTDSAVAAEADYGKATDEDARRTVRDRIVRARIFVIDINYNDFARSLNTEQKAFSIGSDIAVLSLAGAGSLAKSSRTQARFAAWTAGVLGARSAIDKEIYFDKTLPAIIAQMDASRRTSLAALFLGLAQSDSGYSLLQAKADLENYYIAGTLPGALASITKEAGKQAAAADQKIERISDAKYAYTDESKRLRTYWKPDGTTVDPTHAKAIRDWLDENAEGTHVPEFIYGATTAQKKAIIAALSIP